MRPLRRREGMSSQPDFYLGVLEEELRRLAPAASASLIERTALPLRPERNGRAQPAFAAVFTGVLLIALSAVGGVSYAATQATNVARAAGGVFVTRVHVVGKGITAGGDQYRPGYGFGDKNHNHDGPPGLRKADGGQKSPPSQVKRTSDGRAYIVSASIAADEQAALYFSVLDSSGAQLLLTQRGSRVGGTVDGPQAKTIHYVMLVPRSVPLQLRVPANLLKRGQTYTIRVIAVDAQGNKTRFEIPFSA
jgi:hypothetical protein